MARPKKPAKGDRQARLHSVILRRASSPCSCAWATSCSTGLARLGGGVPACRDHEEARDRAVRVPGRPETEKEQRWEVYERVTVRGR
jgi:hypothetical protein